MPMYDFQCKNGHTFERLLPIGTQKAWCKQCEADCRANGGCRCRHLAERVWLPGNANSVIGDEIDVEIKHGLCHEDGTPRRFRSRTELRKAEQKAGLTNFVEHRPPPGTDRSKHTQRWV